MRVMNAHAKPPKAAPASEVRITLTRAEARALEVVAEKGLRVAEALTLIPNTTTADLALRKLRAAL